MQSAAMSRWAPVEIGGVHRRQLDLYRPLAQLGGNDGPGRGGALLPVDGPGLAAGAAAGERGLLLFPGQMGLHRGLVVGGSLPLGKGDGPGGAGGQAVPQAVAVVVPG